MDLLRVCTPPPVPGKPVRVCHHLQQCQLRLAGLASLNDEGSADGQYDPQDACPPIKAPTAPSAFEKGWMHIGVRIRNTEDLQSSLVLKALVGCHLLRSVGHVSRTCSRKLCALTRFCGFQVGGRILTHLLIGARRRRRVSCPRRTRAHGFIPLGQESPEAAFWGRIPFIASLDQAVCIWKSCPQSRSRKL